MAECPLWVMRGHSHRNRDVRFTPESGHLQCTSPCPRWAISGHHPRDGGQGHPQALGNVRYGEGARGLGGRQLSRPPALPLGL